MNERIKEIATEVGISVEYLNNTKQWSLIEGFAELIIKECMLLCTCENPDPRDSIELQCSNRIKQRFGVK